MWAVATRKLAGHEPRPAALSARICLAALSGAACRSPTCAAKVGDGSACGEALMHSAGRVVKAKGMP